MSKLFFIKEEDKIEDGFTYDTCLFPYFPSRADQIKPLGLITLQIFLDSHNNPKPEMLKVFHDIEEATKNGDKTLKDSLKQTKLFYFTPSVLLTERKYEGIVEFTGVMVMEYDKIGAEEAEKLKNKIFKRFKSCICAYMSPSRSGCKFLFKIPKVKTIEEYKEYFYGLASYLEQIDGFDISNQSAVLPLFISYDHDMLIRDVGELETWVLKGKYPKSINNKEASDFKAEDVSEEDRRFIFNIVGKIFKRIDETQEGHNNVIKASLILGGYCGAGYISEEEAIEYIDEKITNSEYCNGRKDYYRTARKFINDGILKPLELKEKGEL